MEHVVEPHGDGASVHGEKPDALFGRLYERLKRLARLERRRCAAGALDTTSLVHEAYLKVARSDRSFERTGQFFAYASISMRHALLNDARARQCEKSGAGVQHVDLDDAADDAAGVSPQQALELDAALQALARVDARAARVVELHFFAGLPLRQVAELLGVVRRTVDRDWRYARAYLLANAA